MVKLRRTLGLLTATTYGIGIIIGAGIYVLIGVAAGATGNALWLSFLLAAVIAVITGLSYAELASMFPKSAAEYIYIKRAYKNDFFAFILGWLIIFVGIVSVSAVSLGFSSYFVEFFLSGNQNFLLYVSSAIIASLALLNYFGIRESSRVNLVLVSLTIIGLIFVISLGLPKLGSVDLFETANGLGGVFVAASLIFFAYLGFEEIVNIAEETRRPTRIIPKALIFAIGISAILYILTSVSVVNLLDWRELGSSHSPLADAVGNSFLGSNGAIFISWIALFATASTVLGIILVTSRMIYGMSAQKALPKILSKINKRTKTPYVAIVVVAAIAILFLSYGNLEKVANVTSVGALIIFTNINAALIWLRYIKPHFKRPFKIPLNIGNYPVISFLGVFASLFMIFQFDYDVIIFGIIISAIGAFFYILRKQKIIPI